MVSRELVNLRVSVSGLVRIDRLATETETNRSEVIRRLLAEALADDALVKRARAKLVDRG
jgi:metal-responsive CopG/Arc/MetJ family transcriptional regulator